MHSHFEDKDALHHVIEKRAQGIVTLSESHGTEMPGSWSAGADSAKETGIFTLILWLFFQLTNVSFSTQLALLLGFGLGFLIWKTGRSAIHGWSRLERLHRVIEQEKKEIDINRQEEREELGALYRAKGFQGKLLEDVLDVLMADQDRLLKVMLEEELGLTLQAYEHPLKQSMGALIGVSSSLLFSLALLHFFPQYGMPVASFCSILIAALVAALYEKNELVPSLIWNLALLAASFGGAFFGYQFFKNLIL